MHLYTCDTFTGTPHPCNEGDLVWVAKDKVQSLPIWQGDKLFFDLLDRGADFFHLELFYDDDTLVRAVLDGKELEV